MDWPPKTLIQWDWESFAAFDGKESELSRTAHVPDWKFQCALEINSGSLYMSGNGVCSVSEMGSHSSNSSISASDDSLAKVGRQRSELKLNVKSKMDSMGTSTLLVPNSPKESLIRLKLGKRAYFENVTLVKTARVYPHSTQSYYCQVEGCNFDLSTAKEYHRKHRVCESHSKSSKVAVAGQERRFCQQCSRFHALSEFDEKKRSCRRRLSDHNARRRKPIPEIISFSSSMIPYDNRRQMNLVFGHDPFNHATIMGNSTWDGTGIFKLTQPKGSWIKSGNDTRLQFPTTGFVNMTSTVHHDLDRLLPYKGPTAEILNQGIEASVGARNLDGGPVRHALSLLSTDPWGSANLGPASNTHLVNTDDSRSSPCDSCICCNNQTTARTLLFNMWKNAGQFQE